jgi:hypothetical protein
MPVNYRFDAKIIVIYMAGEYSINDLRTTLLNSLTDPERPANSSLLLSFGVSQSIYSKSTEEIQRMGDFIASLGNRFNYRLAFVSSRDLPYDLLRFVYVKSGVYGIDSEVFHTYDEAREWLASEYLDMARQAPATRTTKIQQMR